MKGFIPLETPKFIRNRGFGYEHCTTIKHCLPFIESVRGEYTHRVRTAMLHKHPKDPEAHMSFSCWCGYSICISKRHKNRLVSEPSAGRPVCATCEGKAIGAGLLGSREINGQSVMYRPQQGNK